MDAAREPSAERAAFPAQRYAQCIETSKRLRWEIDRDVLRGRRLDFARKFMPDGLSRIAELRFLRPAEARFLSQIQGRTYANMLALVERSVGAKVLDLTRRHWLGDQVALEALVRLTDEALKHQALFRRLDEMAAAGMPDGYCFVSEPNDIATAVLAKSTWAVLALNHDIEIFSQVHYEASIAPDRELSELWQDVFLFHWREEAQHAILHELEWRHEDARVTEAEREQGVTDLVDLVAAVDGICHRQARADADYFLRSAGPFYSAIERSLVQDLVHRAYRWQYIVSGAQAPRFVEVLGALATPAQVERIGTALAPIAAHVAG